MLSDDVGVNKKLKTFSLDFLRAPVPLCENGFYSDLPCLGELLECLTSYLLQYMHVIKYPDSICFPKKVTVGDK